MNTFFPSKHVSFNESIVGIGAIILKHLDGGKAIDDLWRELRGTKASHYRLPERVDFDVFILAVDFLFLVGAVQHTAAGAIVYASR